MKHLKKYNEINQDFFDIYSLKQVFAEIFDEYKTTIKETHQYRNMTKINPDLEDTDNVTKITIKIEVPKVYYSLTGHSRAKCRDLDDLILHSEKLLDLLLDIRVAKARILDIHPDCKIKVEHGGEYHGDTVQPTEIEILMTL